MTACSRLIPTEYTQLSVHSDTQKAQEDPDALTAENFSGLKRAIRSFVSNHIEHGVIRVYNYTGSVEDDLGTAAYEVSREDPLGAYAVDYMAIPPQNGILSIAQNDLRTRGKCAKSASGKKGHRSYFGWMTGG